MRNCLRTGISVEIPDDTHLIGIRINLENSEMVKSLAFPTRYQLSHDGDHRHQSIDIVHAHLGCLGARRAQFDRTSGVGESEMSGWPADNWPFSECHVCFCVCVRDILGMVEKLKSQ